MPHILKLRLVSSSQYIQVNGRETATNFGCKEYSQKLSGHTSSTSYMLCWLTLRRAIISGSLMNKLSTLALELCKLGSSFSSSRSRSNTTSGWPSLDITWFSIRIYDPIKMHARLSNGNLQPNETLKASYIPHWAPVRVPIMTIRRGRPQVKRPQSPSCFTA